jgi:2-aminoethylphosphonate-pyruvate transaminase
LAFQDKLLFTPGPLTTSETVKAALGRDLGSRDTNFIQIVREIRQMLLELAGLRGNDDYTAILMQGSGTFGVESIISSVIPQENGKLLVIINGAYGRRIAAMAKVLHIATVELSYSENSLPDLAEIEETLKQDTDITHIAAIHCETTTGLLNPIEAIGKIVAKYNRVFFVDAMSSFGAIPLDMVDAQIHFLVSSANKCIEGLPGFSFAIVHKETLLQTKGYARSMSLDLLAQWQGLEKNGQFRFTPPVQIMLAFHQALLEIQEEGGVAGRGKRYAENNKIIIDGMKKFGLQPYLEAENQSYIITTFYYPEHPNFDFEIFYQRLSDKGFVIYPGKLTQADCFRIGNIGRLDASHMQGLLDAVVATFEEMEIELVEK